MRGDLWVAYLLFSESNWVMLVGNYILIMVEEAVRIPPIILQESPKDVAFGLSTLHTKGKSPKAVAFQNAYMATLFDHFGFKVMDSRL